MDIETLEELPGEGQEEMVRRMRVRHGCYECGSPAHFKHSYLLDGARRNPASSSYGQDDCSWCSDREEFTCKSCRKPSLDGYGWCSTFPAIDKFAHMFLYWEEVSAKPIKEAT